MGAIPTSGTLALALTSAMAALVLSSASVRSAEAQLPTWSVPMSGIAAGSGYLEVQLARSGWSVYCRHVQATARAQRASKVDGAGLVTLSNVVFAPAGQTCQGPHGFAMDVAVNALPLKFDARAYNAYTGVVTGRVSGISATVESSNGCVLTVAGPDGAPGEVDAAYHNSDGFILIKDDGHLRVTDAGSSCPVVPGDGVLVNGFLVIHPRGIITSP